MENGRPRIWLHEVLNVDFNVMTKASTLKGYLPAHLMQLLMFKTVSVRRVSPFCPSRTLSYH